MSKGEQTGTMAWLRVNRMWGHSLLVRRERFYRKPELKMKEKGRLMVLWINEKKTPTKKPQICFLTHTHTNRKCCYVLIKFNLTTKHALCRHTHTLSSGMNHIASLKQSFHSFCKLQNSSVVTYLYPCKTLGPAILYGSILRVLF